MRLIKAIPLCFLLFLSILGCEPTAKNKNKSNWRNSDTPPNIVFIVLDDLDFVVSKDLLRDTMPSLHREVADKGVTFENSFVTSSLCCPSRASFLTGQYPHNTNVLNNGTFSNGDIADFDTFLGGRQAFRAIEENQRTLVDYLGNSYHKLIVGKYMSGTLLHLKQEDPLREYQKSQNQAIRFIKNTFAKELILNFGDLSHKPHGIYSVMRRRLLGTRLTTPTILKDFNQHAVPGWDEAYWLNGLKQHQLAFGLPPGWDNGFILEDEFGGRRKYSGYAYDAIYWYDHTKPLVVRYDDRKESTAHRQYSTDILFGKAQEMLRVWKINATKKPFFAYLSPTCPHIPLPPARKDLMTANRLYTASKEKFLKRENFMNFDSPGLPSWIKIAQSGYQRINRIGGFALRILGGSMPPNQTNEYHLTDWYNRLGSLVGCDRGIADIVQSLKNMKEWRNTILIVTSDNGYNLGAHGLNQKGMPYEESIRVPTWVAGGKNTNIGSGVINDKAWILNIDFLPTILDLANIPIPPKVDGRSFKETLLTDKNIDNGRNSFLIEFSNNNLTLHDPELTKNIQSAKGAFPSYKAIRARRQSSSGEQKQHLYVVWERLMTEAKIREFEKKKDFPVPPKSFEEIFNLDSNSLLRKFLTEELHYSSKTTETWSQTQLAAVKEGAAEKRELSKTLRKLANCSGASCFNP